MTENDEKQKALDGEKGIVENTTTHEHDRTYENEGSRDLSPMAVSYTHLTLPTILLV